MELYRYTSYHFGAEESLMCDIPFKMRFEHKAEHQKFIETLDMVTEKANAGNTEVGTETFNWLVGWLLEHISVTDKQLVAHLPRQ